jgi:hypothetical protein
MEGIDPATARFTRLIMKQVDGINEGLLDRPDMFDNNIKLRETLVELRDDRLGTTPPLSLGSPRIPLQMTSHPP